MLVLSRKSRESVVVCGDDGIHRLLKVTVFDVQGENVKLGFEIDADVRFHRWKKSKRTRARNGGHGAAGVPAAPVMQCLGFRNHAPRLRAKPSVNIHKQHLRT
jgi:sRNA-binding carbon storage regulator CsrA